MPATNSAAVSTAPNRTSLHSRCASGSSLKIAANSAATTTNANAALSIVQTAAGTGRMLEIVSTVACSTVVRISDVSSMNPVPSTIENERKRSRSTVLSTRPGFGITPHTVFSASCNWPNTPPAPMSSTTSPVSVARMLSDGFRVRITMSCTASAAFAPMVVRSWWASSPLAASSPKTAPAIEMAIRISGASENME